MRCDMAMLLMNSIFERTWGNRAGIRPATEYWQEVIPAVRKSFPDFLFIAEAYWDLEWELQQQGFDYCYDKKLYDRLEHGNAENVRLPGEHDLIVTKSLGLGCAGAGAAALERTHGQVMADDRPLYRTDV